MPLSNNLVAHSPAKFKMIPKPSNCSNHCAMQPVTISWTKVLILGSQLIPSFAVIIAFFLEFHT
jgi:hypothetical protein